ncbi:GLUG motif-containing protein, partial [Treponema primitia]|uniref:GLUG motif-containing protein n=1 Tax=Treponema primitia TaxID=88058 RepID=UPI000255513D
RYAGTVDLAAGNYLVQVKLTRGDLSATRGWVAHLYPGLETLAAGDFGELDLKPALMGTVSLDGSAVYGETLTATPDLKGTGDPIYVWKRRDSTAGTEAAITEASGSTYTLTVADVGKLIAVEVSRTGYDGSKRDIIGPVAPASIIDASVTGLVAPATGQPPVATTDLRADGDTRYMVTDLVWEQTYSPSTSTVTWDGVTFKPQATYRATITLQAYPGYKFTDGITPTVDGTTLEAVNPSGDTAENTLTFTVSFPATTGGKAEVTPSTDWVIPKPTLVITKSCNIDLIGPDETLTLSLDESDYSDYRNFRWTVNGSPVTADDTPTTGAAYTFGGAGRSPGTYTVGVKAQTTDGPWYEDWVTVTVANLAIEGYYTGSISGVVEDGLLKSITTDGDEILIGRKEEELVTLNLDEDGKLQFRAVEDGFIPIGSYAEFQLINTAGNLSKKYKQEADLDLLGIPPAGVGSNWSGQKWTAIGSNSNGDDRFFGLFDGDGKAINNLFIDNTSNFQGLFGYVGRDGKVKNVHIASGSVNGAKDVGGVVGCSDWGEITDCSNSSSVNGANRVGGVVGDNLYGTITTCSNTGDVTGTDKLSNVGGIVGGFTGGSITDCSNSGSIKGAERVGGVAGSSNSVENKITGCSNSGSVSGASNVGGMVGVQRRSHYHRLLQQRPRYRHRHRHQ